MTEKQFMSAVRQLAELCGWLVYHTHDSRRSPAGFPDLVLVRGGVLLFVELKSERGRVRPEQQRWLDALRVVGCGQKRVGVHVWRPEDWHDGTIERVLAKGEGEGGNG